MNTRRSFIKATAGVAALIAGRPFPTIAAPSPSHVALVIGNDQYKQAPLENAANDARAMADLLKRAGFEVGLELNATRAAMHQAIEALGRALSNPAIEIALCYYAGHAVQLDWRNYLLPSDAEVRRAADIKAQCIDLGLLLEQLAKAKGKTAIIILDACRDNPFGTVFRPDRKGLSQFDAPAGSLLAYATSPGGVAIDGVGGDHGLYTEHLLRELPVKGVRIEDTFKRVRLNVRLASNGGQIPWESTSLERDVVLFPGPTLSESEVEKQLLQDLAQWNRIKESSKADDWIAYLRQFPNGRFSEIAQDRLNRLGAASKEPAPSSAPTVKPRIEISAGLPVPSLYGEQQNPYSAGVHPWNRKWSVGDEATFNVLDRFSGVVQRKLTVRVTRVNPQANRVVFNDGFRVSDLMGNLLKAGKRRFSVPAQFFPAELQIGKKWTAAFEVKFQGREATADIHLHIARKEKVTVPAGEFDTFRIDGAGSVGRRRIEWHAWVVPGLNFVVRQERAAWAGGRLAGGANIELVSVKQYR